MTPPLTLLVMAAGMGSRYGGLKQIDPVGPGGETMMDYSIHDAIRAGFGKVVFVIRRQIEEPFKQTIGARFEKRIEVQYAFQELDALPQGFRLPEGRTKPWGTTHAVLSASDAIRGPFAVINADDFYGATSYEELARQLRSGSEDYAMVGFTLRNTLSEFGSVARGVCEVSADGYLEKVVELTQIEGDGDGIYSKDADGGAHKLSGDETVSMNMWGFTSSIFAELRGEFRSFLERTGPDLRSECYLPDAVNRIVTGGRGRVKVLRTPDTWFGATYREDHARVAESIRRLVELGNYPERLWA
ncbi:MAG TPA: sugar phosphate nucleotidyltransferase [Terracidiphilus sp.]|nr:sugar phosphate nucleotidyltransferase [Terracidiphilus sp.]